jgi:lysozyme family protein
MASPEDFKWALKFTLKWEGGDHRPTLADPNPTSRGVTQRFYNLLVKSQGFRPSSVFDLTSAEIASIYERIWISSHAPSLPRLVATANFDANVNMSRPRATRILQRALGTRADGLWGPETAYAASSGKPHETVKRMCGWREEEYTELVAFNPKLKVFLQGWLNRVKGLREYLGVGR